MFGDVGKARTRSVPTQPTPPSQGKTRYHRTTPLLDPHVKMRSAWHICGMPLRRPRKRRNAPPTPAPPLALHPLPQAQPPAPPAQKLDQTLLRYAESTASSAGLSSVDFGEVDDLSATFGVPTERIDVRVDEFSKLKEAVRAVGVIEPVVNNDEPFRVPEWVFRQWVEDGRAHNHILGGLGEEWGAREAIDIRGLVSEFCERKYDDARRRPGGTVSS